MGLDQFLMAKKFFWTVDYKTEKQNKEAETIKKMFPEMKGNKLNYVVFEVGYWRKANAIHKWFVDIVQDGEDDCKTYFVSREQLKELKELCKKVIDIAIIKKRKVGKDEKGKTIYEEYIVNEEEIAKILPTTSGFFFGSTEYDEWYIQNIKDTIAIIDKCLSLSEEWEFEYSSSW